jgi:5-oxoprolinase (ATP-hydrolysing) subunit A
MKALLFGGRVIKMEGRNMFQVDLNCDLGESFGRYKLGEQEEILKYVTSANIACGFHSGDPSVMRETVKMAVANGVKIGAHPGLPDLNGFGRREMAITPQEGYDMVVYQIGALQGFLMTFNEKMQHVKPHGALYNMAAKDRKLAEAIAQAVYDVSPSLILFGLAGSELTKAGEKIGLRTAHEVFADRTYQADGSLTSRSQMDALITDQEQSVAQIVKMVTEGKVLSQQKTEVSLRADTICIHGDGAHALAFAKYINETLDKNNITVDAISNLEVYYGR